MANHQSSLAPALRRKDERIARLRDALTGATIATLTGRAVRSGFWLETLMASFALWLLLASVSCLSV